MQKGISLNSQLLPGSLYNFLFTLLGLVYVAGLFVPLMDNDSAHHANIALHMHLTGDYVNLVDYGKDYLDKPHLHFWLAAFSYKVFGVTTFAYKFPSLLFTILGTYSTYRLGKSLYNKDVGKLAALIVASSFAYMLANNDVRMDAILTASIIFATWQLVEFVDNKKILHTAGAALGLALGFCTKGHIAVFTPVVAILFYILYKKDWALFYNWKWIVLVTLFGLFISPVVYCYYLQYNLHPEKIVRGKDHVNGVKFILLSQSVERFSGGMGSDSKNDRLFFLHSFLWAFAPWSIVGYLAFFTWLKTFFTRKQEWLTTGIFAVMLITISLSGFKLPHYLNIVFPATAVMTAAFLLSKKENPRWIRSIFIIQLIVCILLLLLAALINVWAFPVHKWWISGCTIFLLSLFFSIYIFYKNISRLQKSIAGSVVTITLVFFLLNTNFYPKLLTYQGGNELAFVSKGKVNPEYVYFSKEYYSSSWNFYTATIRKDFSDSVLQPGKKTWLLFDIRDEPQIKLSGYLLGERFTAPDYEITKLDIKFVNPERRKKELTTMVLAEVSR